jgi:hypothetical protein
MAKHVPQALAELRAQLGDPFVCGAAVWAVVAAVLDENDGGLRVAEHVIARVVDGTVETVAGGFEVGHRRVRAFEPL